VKRVPNPGAKREKNMGKGERNRICSSLPRGQPKNWFLWSRQAQKPGPQREKEIAAHDATPRPTAQASPPSPKGGSEEEKRKRISKKRGEIKSASKRERSMEEGGLLCQLEGERNSCRERLRPLDRKIRVALDANADASTSGQPGRHREYPHSLKSGKKENAGKSKRADGQP